ncbi:MAG: hypothetical protein HPY80_00295 [Bacteroidales bacterium]|nr:hypothetical protein [Bacteroidales bacterium]
MAGTRFKVSDEQVNDAGFRILTKGIDFTSFLQNPVMLWRHERYDSRMLPIGRWENLKIENGSLTAEAVLDENDPFAKQIKNKVDQGFINACSIGIQVLEVSEEPKFMLPGQTRGTVTKCILLEISLVDIPGNKNSVRLYKDDKIIALSAGEDSAIIPIINKHQIKMKSIAVKLGLAENATEEQILQEIAKLQNEKQALAAENLELKNKEMLALKARAEELVDEAIAACRITADKKESFVKLALSDYESTKALLEAIQPVKRPTEMVQRKPVSPSPELKSWDDLVKLGRKELERVKLEQPELYRNLYREKYKREANI